MSNALYAINRGLPAIAVSDAPWEKLPWTTLAWVVMYEISPRGIDGFDWLIVGFAFVVDIMSYAKTSQARGQN